jgi:hypothetical protein
MEKTAYSIYLDILESLNKEIGVKEIDIKNIEDIDSELEEKSIDLEGESDDFIILEGASDEIVNLEGESDDFIILEGASDELN